MTRTASGSRLTRPAVAEAEPPRTDPEFAASEHPRYWCTQTVGPWRLQASDIREQRASKSRTLLDRPAPDRDIELVSDALQQLRALSGGHPNDRRHVWYALSGTELDPADVTTLTGIAPDHSWRAGDLHPRTGGPHAEGFWKIDSGLRPEDEFHDHVDALVTRLRPAWSALVELGRRYEARVDAAIYCLEAQGPLVQVLPEVAAALHDLNATLGFDIYALPKEPPGDEATVGRLTRSELASLMSNDIPEH